MRIKRLLLQPFAAFSSKEIEFEPGLNLILGANDVGKSTVFRAIDSALFLSSKVSRSTREGKELARILPAGADQAKVALEGEAQSGDWKIERRWGQGAGLAFEGGGGAKKVSQEEKLEPLLRELLPVPPVTFQNVLFMSQGSLERTVAGLEEKRESLHSLGDFLRLAVDKNAGLSVDRLKDILRKKIASSFSCWDRKTGLPEKNRGIENPWQKNVGTVLAAYYARELARRDAASAEELEASRDRKIAELAARQEKRNQARAFVAANKEVVEGASRRAELEAKFEKAKGESDLLVKDLDAWGKAEAQKAIFEPEVARVSAAVAALEEELKQAIAQVKHKDLGSRIEKAREAKRKVEEAAKLVSRLVPLRPEDLRRLRGAQLEVDALRTSLKAGKIQLTFTVKKDLEVSVRKDLDPERKGQMTPAKGMSLSAGGRIQLSSDLFELQVLSGDGRFSEIEEQLDKKSQALAALYASFKTQNLDEAQQAHDTFLEAQNAVKSAEALLQASLQPGERLEELERLAVPVASSAAAPSAVATGSTPAARDPSLIQAELASLQKDLAGKKEGLVRAVSLLKDFERRHGVAESRELTRLMIKKQAELDSLERQLASLPALPEGMGRLDLFLERFRKESDLVSSLGEEIQALSVELADLRARLPEQSAEDLKRAAQEASAAFDRELRSAHALLRVEEAVLALDQSGGDIYQGFQREFEEKVAALSRGKYQKATMEESLPSAFHRQDGAAIPYSWLSAGTKDAFALALRLSMASYFLGTSRGFLLLDDPLVNMDPERQKVAAEMLKEFSRERQVILFTCHPSHAELLGGHQIRL